MTKQLKPCPFCGENPSMDAEGSCIEIYCCASMSMQKNDCLNLDERCTWNNDTHSYSKEAEEKALSKIISEWNTRAISEDEKEQLSRLKGFVNQMFNDIGEAEYPLYKFRLLEIGIFVADEKNIARKSDWLKD